MRSDIAWWAQFLESWNGVAMISAGRKRSGCHCDIRCIRELRVWGILGQVLVWSGEMCREPIMVKELVPVVVAAAVWGKQWRELVVCCRSDNQAAVAAVNSRTCHNASMMHMLRCLFFFKAHFEFKLVASYIPGKENVLADDLSRNHLDAFCRERRQQPVPRLSFQSRYRRCLDLSRIGPQQFGGRCLPLF